MLGYNVVHKARLHTHLPVGAALTLIVRWSVISAVVVTIAKVRLRDALQVRALKLEEWAIRSHRTKIVEPL